MGRLAPPDVVSTLGQKGSIWTHSCDFLCHGRAPWQGIFTEIHIPERGIHSRRLCRLACYLDSPFVEKHGVTIDSISDLFL